MINVQERTSLRQSFCQVKWQYVVLFIAIAYAVSLPSNVGWLTQPTENLSWPFGLSRFALLAQGVGPLVAGVILRKIDYRDVDSTLKGHYGYTGLMLFSVSLLTVTIIGNPNEKGLDTHYWGLVTALVFSMHALFEEVGWRGYLEHALRGLPEFWRVLIIGTIWYLWHMSLFAHNSLHSEVVFFGILLLGTWLLGRLFQYTKSLLIVAAFHSIFNLIQWWAIDFTDKIIVMAVFVLLWILILNYYRRYQSKSN